jgi:sulfur-oxidizing protein SoxY
MVFSEAVTVRGPAFADDAMNVPLLVDARGLAGTGGGVAHMLVVVDRNPVREVLAFEPLRALPMLAFRIRMEQASPVRAMVQTADGRWHVGGTWVQAAGGGCTVPGATRADGSWSRTLNQVQARFFPNVIEGSRRLRVRVMHPMDTGLVAGIPAFYIEQLQLVDSAGQAWWRLALHEPVSENPLLTFELPPQRAGGFRLTGRDNNGNRIDAEVPA